MLSWKGELVCLIIRCFQKSVVLDEKLSRVMMRLRVGHQIPERILHPLLDL